MKANFYFNLIMLFLAVTGCKNSTNTSSSFKMFDQKEAENKFDKDGLKTGKWIEYFTMDFKHLPDSKDYDLYRLAEYKKGKPYGKFAYYYKSGKLYLEGSAANVKDDNTFTLDKEAKWYFENGQLAKIENYNNDGELDGKFNSFYENGNTHANLLIENGLNKEGVVYSEDKKVSFKYFPNWANSTNDIDKRVVLFENFDAGNDNLNLIGSNDGGNLINGKLFVETKEDNYIKFFWTDFKLDKGKDFEISAEVELLESKTVSGEVGILWGTKDSENLHGIIIEPFDDFYIPYKIFSNIKSFERNHISSNSVPQTKENIPNAFILSIERNKDNINFKIDGEIIHTILFQDFFGDKLGFIVGNCPVKATFDNLTVKYKRI